MSVAGLEEENTAMSVRFGIHRSHSHSSELQKLSER